MTFHLHLDLTKKLNTSNLMLKIIEVIRSERSESPDYIFNYLRRVNNGVSSDSKPFFAVISSNTVIVGIILAYIFVDISNIVRKSYQK